MLLLMKVLCMSSIRLMPNPRAKMLLLLLLLLLLGKTSVAMQFVKKTSGKDDVTQQAA